MSTVIYSYGDNKVEVKNSPMTNTLNNKIAIPPFPEIHKKTVIDKVILDSPVQNYLNNDSDHGRFYDRFYLESDSRFFYQNFKRGNNEIVHLTDKIDAGSANSIDGDDYPTTYRSRVLTPVTITLDAEDSTESSMISLLYYKR